MFCFISDTLRDSAVVELQKQIEEIIQDLNLLKEKQALQTGELKLDQMIRNISLWKVFQIKKPLIFFIDFFLSQTIFEIYLSFTSTNNLILHCVVSHYHSN